MRNQSNETAILSSSAPVVVTDLPRRAPVIQKASERDEKDEKVEKLAKEFVRWCFSFGSDFRNSPDITNLRVWCRKTKTKLKSAEEEAVLTEAQKVFAAKLRQTLRKVTADNPENDTTIPE